MTALLSKHSASSRRVLITGATGALGAAVVSRFLSAGDSVVGVYAPTQNPSKQPEVEWVSADLTCRKAVEELFSKVGEIDSVVHCAGGFRYGSIDSLSEEDFRFLTALNFESSYFVAAAAVPVMKKRKKGTLTFISSMATLNPGPGLSAYAASKSAVNAMVTSLAVELKEFGIQVNAVLPSVIDTDANRRDMPKADFSKWVSTEELAEIIYDLTLSKSRSITGALIPVVGRV